MPTVPAIAAATAAVAAAAAAHQSRSSRAGREQETPCRGRPRGIPPPSCCDYTAASSGLTLFVQKHARNSSPFSSRLLWNDLTLCQDRLGISTRKMRLKRLVQLCFHTWEFAALCLRADIQCSPDLRLVEVPAPANSSVKTAETSATRVS